MNRSSVALMALVLSSGCVRLTRSIALDIPAAANASAAVAQFDIPKDWVPLESSAARAEFIGPDRRSRAYLRALPATRSSEKCPGLMRRYADEVIDSWGGPPQTRVANRFASERDVRFELRRTDPKPHGEVIWSRVQCREGALAIATCTVSQARKQELAPMCRQLLDSLQISSAVDARGSGPRS